MNNIYSRIVELQNQRIKAAICTIVETQGSTPRKPGSKMLVIQNGETEGTIGGGIFEKKVVETALDVIKTNHAQIFSFTLTQKEGMGCGGQAKVFIEPIINTPLLVIFGAGHVGKILAKMALQFDFQPVLIDPRPEMFENQNTENIIVILREFTDAINHIDFSTLPYLAIMTNDHDTDFEILAQVIQKEYTYIGVIGSKAKIAAAKKKLLENKQATEEQLDRINWPIGIGIRCDTPEEIALSVVAKIIDVKRNKTT